MAFRPVGSQIVHQLLQIAMQVCEVEEIMYLRSIQLLYVRSSLVERVVGAFTGNPWLGTFDSLPSNWVPSDFVFLDLPPES